jgi:hypothetical protein
MIRYKSASASIMLPLEKKVVLWWVGTVKKVLRYLTGSVLVRG